LSFNRIIIYGYLGRDPELRYTAQGTPVCSLSIATTERRKDRNGEMQDHTTWFRVTCWNRMAETVSQYLSKGSPAYFEGRLRTEEYTDRDGKPRTSLEVNATDFQFIGKRDDGDHSSSNPRPTQPTAPAQPGRSTGLDRSDPSYDPADDDDIPF